jgi:DNA-binding IclR family transcriptional regulator
MKQNQSEEEIQIIKAIKRLNGKASIKKIAKEANMSPSTASKYLAVLEGKGIIKKDTSQLPYKFWEIVKEGIS